MKVILMVMGLAAGSLGWLAADGGARRSLIREGRHMARAMDAEVTVRKMMADLEAWGPEDSRTQFLLGLYHTESQRIYPRGSEEAIGKKYGSRDHERGVAYLRAAAASGHRGATWSLWRVEGYPETDKLLEMAGSGNEMALQKLTYDATLGECDMDLALLERLERVAKDAPTPTADKARYFERVLSDVGTLRTWHEENCAG